MVGATEPKSLKLSQIYFQTLDTVLGILCCHSNMFSSLSLKSHYLLTSTLFCASIVSERFMRWFLFWLLNLSSDFSDLFESWF